MLILTRKLGESINIGDDIKISVLNISGLQVRIGVEAPPDIIVHREEIFNKIKEENKKDTDSINPDSEEKLNISKENVKKKPDDDKSNNANLGSEK